MGWCEDENCGGGVDDFGTIVILHRDDRWIDVRRPDGSTVRVTGLLDPLPGVGDAMVELYDIDRMREEARHVGFVHQGADAAQSEICRWLKEQGMTDVAEAIHDGKPWGVWPEERAFKRKG